LGHSLHAGAGSGSSAIVIAHRRCKEIVRVPLNSRRDNVLR
jgi:hypothetical protein